MSGSSPASNGQELTGRQIAGFRLLRKLGSGGMAEVYLAEQSSLGRQVALKVLRAEFIDDPSYVARFLQEARAAASLVHPNIVQIHEVGEAEGIHFIAQEYVPGKNLDQILERQGAFSPGLVLEVMRQVTSALAKANEHGIVHRDIKPANILFSPSGIVKVADFGLARVMDTSNKTLTQMGVAMGTPLYMSPEQIEGRPVDSRSDIYSLGITCYHLLAGEPPYGGETALAIAIKHLNNPHEPLEKCRPDLDPQFVDLINRMMAKHPDQRISTPGELLDELRELATRAAEAGWAIGPEQWSLVEWIASDGSRSEASAKLGELMRVESRLKLPHWNRWRLVLLFLGSTLLGILVAYLLRPDFYLERTTSADVPLRPSVAAQLYHAKMSESEAGWKAVWRNFPDADPFYIQLAQQGLVRYYLFVSQEFEEAMPVLEKLIESTDPDEESQETLRAFAFAAMTICNEQLGRNEQANEAYAQLTPSMRDHLNQNESQLFELLQSSRRRLRR